jgi:hypothetical protein
MDMTNKTYLQELEDEYPSSKRQKSKKASMFQRYKNKQLGRLGAASVCQRVPLDSIGGEDLGRYVMLVNANVKKAI